MANGQQYDNELRGALFANDRQGNDRAPNAKGRIQIKGVVYFLSAWTKTDRNGNRFQSLSAEVAPEKYQPKRAAPAPVAQEDFTVLPPEEEIPFAFPPFPFDAADAKVHASRPL